MKTQLCIDPKDGSKLAADLTQAHAEHRGCDPTSRIDLFLYLDSQWRKTLFGFEVAFDYLLRRVPLALREEEIAMVIVTGHVDDTLLNEGPYEPAELPVRAFVESYVTANGGRAYKVRIEVDGGPDVDALALANDYLGKIRRHEVEPTTAWSEAPPQG